MHAWMFILGGIIVMWFIFVFRLSKRTHRKIDHMIGMVIAMGTAMFTGLTIGTYFGKLIPSELLFATILSMLIASGSGVIIGSPFGVLSMAEGFFSGVMSAMMGTMLSVMLSPSEQIVLTKGLLLTTLVLFILTYHWLYRELHK